MDRLHAMRVFTRIVEAGKLSSAADSLGLPRPSVTKVLKALEAELGTRLLHRTTRRQELTVDGVAYYARAVRILADLDELHGTIGERQSEPRGRLRIDVGSAMARRLLIPALPTLLDRHPELHVDLGVGDRAADLVGEKVDCVVRVGEIVDDTLVARRIGLLPFVTAAAPSYLRRHGEPRHPSELEAHRIVHYASPRTGRLIPQEYRRPGERIVVAGASRISVNETNAYVAAAVTGLGVAQPVAFMVEGELAKGELVPILGGWTRTPLPVHVAYPDGRYVSARVRAFVDWASSVLAAYVDSFPGRESRAST